HRLWRGRLRRPGLRGRLHERHVPRTGGPRRNVRRLRDQVRMTGRLSARPAPALPLIVSLLLLLPGAAQAQTVIWTREFGTTRDDIALAAAANSTDVYVAYS